MSSTASQVLDAALALPESDRAKVICELISSLEDHSDDDVETAWREEIGRRTQEIKTGAVKTIPWDEARKMIRDDDGG